MPLTRPWFAGIANIRGNLHAVSDFSLFRGGAPIVQNANARLLLIGTRHGEKKHECLVNREEMAKAEDLGGYYRIPPDGRDLNYTKFVEQGEARIQAAEDYTSHNTERLDVAGMTALLMKLDFMRRIAAGEANVTAED